MTRTKGNIYKAISLVTAFMILCSCFPAFTGGSDRVKAAVNATIDNFYTGFSEGADYNTAEGKYIWTPDSPKEGHRFIYYVGFELSGEGFYEPGEVRIILPLHILKDRYGDYADRIEMSVPSAEEVESYDDELFAEDNQFQYEIDEDNNEIIITNYLRFSAASDGYIELAYCTSKTTFDYRDMSESESFWADIELLDPNNQVMASDHSDSVPVTIDTAAKVTSTAKECLNRVNPYSSWDTSWGNAPTSFDTDEYYYLVWKITSYINNPTQPYNLLIEDVLTDTEGNPVTDGEPVAYKFAGEATFRNIDKTDPNYRKNQKYASTDGVRYDYVITKHPKADYQELREYTLKNTETITLTPYDEIDEPTQVSAAATFYHYQVSFVEPGPSLSSEKRGNSNWWTYWPVADYGLQDLKDGPDNGGVDHLSGNIKFAVNTSGYVFPYTRTDDGDREDISSYGHKKVKFVVTDDSFYLNQTFQFSGYKAVIPEELTGVTLTSEDFRLDHIDYSYTLQDGVKDTENNRFKGVTATPTEDDILYFYFKFGENDWTQTPVASYNAFTGESSFDGNYIKEMTAGRITFKDNVDCVGYRIETVNAHYATMISATPYCWIKRSDTILAQSEGVNKITLTNISNYSVTTDYDTETDTGTMIYDRDSLAEDYIIGVEKESEIKKEVSFTSNSPLKRRVEIGWQVRIAEHYETNEGRRYVPQETGVFYDLLPSGTLLNKQSVAVGVSDNNDPLSVRWLRSNEFEFDTKPNYKDTGRILLTVRIKANFNSAIVSYSTFYSWDSAMDYGTKLLNTVAYETGNAKIAGGYPDDGGEIGDKDAMSGLDNSSSGDRFIYEQKIFPIRILVSTRTGLTKNVRENDALDYKKETSVRQAAQYLYKLRYSTTIITKAKDMVLYDSLENAVINGKESDWHGVLTDINLAQPVEIGIAPVVYLSAVEGLDVDTYHDVDSDEIDGNKVWLKEEEFIRQYGDLNNSEITDHKAVAYAKAKAVAVDLRRDAEGNEFILPNNKSVVVELIMNSPPQEDSDSEDPITYNSVYIDDTVIDMINNEEEDNFIRFDYTAVHFKICGDIGIQKVEQKDGEPIDENNIKPVKDIGFKLSGTSKYGTIYNEILYTDAEGKLVFTDIEQNKPLPDNVTEDTVLSENFYILEEIDGNDDYFKIDGPIQFRIDEEGNTWVGQQLINKDGYFLVGNKPRVHADIEFTKKDLRYTYRTVNGAKFMLTGKSAYPPYMEGTYYAVSGEMPAGVDDGVVRFENVEMGEYTLSEVESPEDHILLQSVNFKVVIDENGNYTMTAADKNGSAIDTEFFDDSDGFGPYTVYNEPYHRFTILKTGLTMTDTNVAGAVFRLWGTSDNFTDVDMTETTELNGQLTFSRLEAGTYKLKELSAPEGYECDSTERRVTIAVDGTVTIEGAQQDDQGRFVITNPENGTITVYKEWRDGKTNAQREADGIADPVISITTDVTQSEATFSSNLRTLMLNLTKDEQNVTHVEKIKTFKQYTRVNGRTIVEQGIANGTVIKADDGTTENVIYIWLEDDGTLYWWSDARNVYFPANSSSIFQNFTNMTVFDPFGLNLSKVEYMEHMFECSGITSIDFSGKDLHSLKSANYMFLNTGSLETVNFSGADLSSLESMQSCFWFTWATKKIKTVDFSGADLSSLKNISHAFNGCTALETVDFSGCIFNDTIENMTGMFYNCQKLKNLDMTQLGSVTKVKSMESMFYNCSSLTKIDLTNFDTSNVTNMSSMFSGCSSLETVVVSATWSTNAVTSSYGMFSGCTSIRGKNDTTYDSAKTDKTYARVDDPANGKPGYFTDVPTTGSGARTVTVFSTSSSADTFTFTSTDTQHCTIEKRSDTLWVYTFTNIEAGRDYFACEDNADYFKEQGYEVGYRSNDGRLLEYKSYIDLSKGENTIVNTNYVPVFGSLTIEKVLDEEQEGDLTEYDREKTFRFILTLTDENAQPFTGTINNFMFNSQGQTRLSIKGEGTITISNIPAGYHYSVTEQLTDENFTASIDGAAEGVLIAEGEILEDKTAEVTFRNTKTHVDIVPASFRVEKIIDDKTAVNDDVSFSFGVTLQGLQLETGYELSDGTRFASDEQGRGYVSFTLKNGESVVFSDIPDGATATVTEQADKDSIASYEVKVNGNIAEKQTGSVKNKALSTRTITARNGVETTVTFTNQRIILQDLKIKKTVPNATDANEDSFHFNLRFKGLTPGLRFNFNGSFITANDEGALDADIEFDLTNGGVVTVEGINVGAQYRILETKSPSYVASYKMTDANGLDLFESGDGSGAAANDKRDRSISTAYERMDEGEDVTVEFVNTKITHDIIVKKMVEVLAEEITEDEYKSKEFSFNVELSGLDKDKTYIAEIGSTREAVVSDENGNAVYTAVLRHDETFKLKDLPVGAFYTISEAPEKFYVGRFEAQANDNEAVIALREKKNYRPGTELTTAEEQVDEYDNEITFIFTNTYSAAGYVLPAAGVDDIRPLAIMLLGGMVFFAAAYWFITKRSASNKTS